MTTVTAPSDIRRFDASQGPRNIGPEEGKAVELPTVGVRFMAWAEETGGGFSLVEHPIATHTLVAPVLKHSRENEYHWSRGLNTKSPALPRRLRALLRRVCRAHLAAFMLVPARAPSRRGPPWRPCEA